jgi:hypothetical protein
MFHVDYTQGFVAQYIHLDGQISQLRHFSHQSAIVSHDLMLIIINDSQLALGD